MGYANGIGIVFYETGYKSLGERDLLHLYRNGRPTDLKINPN